MGDWRRLVGEEREGWEGCWCRSLERLDYYWQEVWGCWGGVGGGEGRGENVGGEENRFDGLASDWNKGEAADLKLLPRKI